MRAAPAVGWSAAQTVLSQPDVFWTSALAVGKLCAVKHASSLAHVLCCGVEEGRAPTAAGSAASLVCL